jgi:hypothetical protein
MPGAGAPRGKGKAWKYTLKEGGRLGARAGCLPWCPGVSDSLRSCPVLPGGKAQAGRAILECLGVQARCPAEPDTLCPSSQFSYSPGLEA